jgi:hypothetical protein
MRTLFRRYRSNQHRTTNFSVWRLFPSLRTCAHKSEKFWRGRVRSRRAQSSLFQTDRILGHNHRACSTSSGPFLHISHIWSCTIFRLIRFLFVGIASCTALQRKCWIFFGTLVAQSSLHMEWPKVGFELPGWLFNSSSTRKRYPLLTV